MLKNIIIALLLFAVSFQGFTLFNFNDKIVLLKKKNQTLKKRHKKALFKSKVKERGKRVATAIPFLGLAAAAVFEKYEYDEWKKENPDADLEDYKNEILVTAKEILNETNDRICSNNESYCDYLNDGLNNLPNSIN